MLRLLINANSRYKDVYSSDYNYTTNTFGEALWETSSTSSGWGWYSDRASYSASSFLARGGFGTNISPNTNIGIFAFESDVSFIRSHTSFRPVLVVGTGL